MMADRRFAKALESFRRGRFAQAEEICRELLRDDPQNPRALDLLGVIALQEGRLLEAAELIQRAVDCVPSDADFQNHLGAAFFAAGDFERAAGGFERAARLNPQHPDARPNLARCLRLTNRFDEALAVNLELAGRFPSDSRLQAEIGMVLGQLGRTGEAIGHFEDAIRCDPGFAEAHYRLGMALRTQDRPREAAAAFRGAIRAKPNFAAAHVQLGLALSEAGLACEAVAAYRESVEQCSDSAELHNNYATALLRLGRLADAIAAYRQALKIKPDFAVAHSNLLCALSGSPFHEPEEVFEAHLEFAGRHAGRVARFRVHPNDRTPDRRLRVGYISYFAPEEYFVTPLVASHDRNEFEVFCYGDLSRMPQDRLKDGGIRWREIGSASDEEVASLIREDAIDLLVDRVGHMGGGRPLVLAAKPAPVAVSLPGYACSTGLREVDYRITDARADPPGTTEHLHVETLVRMPHVFICFHPPAGAPAVNELPAIRSGGVTFGCFHALRKISPQAVAVWAAILHRTPGSSLLFHHLFTGVRQVPADFCEPLVRMFAGHGIGASRLRFIGSLPLEKHLALHHEVDLALDAFPFNGMTTTCDALWMGVPVVTLAGRSHVSRVGLTYLSAAGLPGFITYSLDQYVETAVRYARDLDQLARLRAGLRQQVAACPLADAAGFARALERAYRWMWRRWCAAGWPPELTRFR